MLGPPGSGKGTQAKLLAEDLKLKHIVASDLIKEEIKNSSSKGKLMKSYLTQGKLVPENLVGSLIKEVLPENNFLLDGYPRTVMQAEFLDGLNKPNKVIFLDAPIKILKDRMLKRAKIENRVDDTPEIINLRLEIYKKETNPLLDYYKDRLIKVNGNRSVEEIEKELLKKLKNANRSS